MKSATQIIEELESLYRQEPEIFEFQSSMYLMGSHNKKLRQDVIYTLTGTKPPASKAGLMACVIQLKIKYDQQALF